MSSGPAAHPTAQRFTLSAPPPVRALAIAAATEVLGALLLVGWQAFDLPLAAAVLGGLLLAFGTVLLAAALVLSGRVRTEVQLAPDSITVVRGGQRRSARWSQVAQVRLQHPQLHVLTTDPAAGLVIINPRAEGDRVFSTLLEALRQRLDTDRGHGDLRGAEPDVSRPETPPQPR